MQRSHFYDITIYMFTGIVEEIGIVKNIQKTVNGAVITVECKKVLEDVKLGDSIAIDGVCQTVISFNSSEFTVEVSPETINITTLGNLTYGKNVNLERAMPLNGRFGGHMVMGHVDGTGTFLKKEKQGISEVYYFQVPLEVSKYLVHKGSVCINGVSLTIASLSENIFTIAVIPHTLDNTNLKTLKPNDSVNLESDVIAKYVEKFLLKADNTSETITLDYLKEHGFTD